MFCGLDFGTSNSALGVEEDGLVQLCELEDNNVTMPSAVFYKLENNSPVYGTSAVNEFLTGTKGRLIKSMKSLLGTPLLNDKTIIGVDLSTRTPIEIEFYKIISNYIAQLKSKAESQLGQSLYDVVIGRPVRFHDYYDEFDKKAEEALLKIARECGFANIEFQLEPVAASILYQNLNSNREETILIADIGGGTSDFSVVKLDAIEKNPILNAENILANGGVHLGGTDFDASLSLDCVMPHFGFRSLLRFDNIQVPTRLYYLLVRWNSILENYRKTNIEELDSLKGWYSEPHLYERFVTLIKDQQGHALLDKVEKTKIQLTDKEIHQFKMALRAEFLAFDIHYSELNDALNDNINSIIKAANDTIVSSGVSANDINRIVFTGGSSLVPFLKSSLKQLVPNAKVSDKNVFDAVGLGLTIDARNKFS